MIRSAQPDDLPALVQLEQQCNPSPWSATQLAAAFHTPNHIIIDATDKTINETPAKTINGNQANIAAMLVWQQVCDEWEIHLIDTLPAYRRQGRAQRLLNHLFHTVRTQQQSGRVLLEVRAGNHAALALYRRNGFIECGCRRGYYSDTEDAILMEKTC